MVNCNLQQRDDGRWFCPRCDRGQQRLLPVAAQRNCEMPASRVLAAAMEGKAQLGRVFVDNAEIRRRVDICEACENFSAFDRICLRIDIPDRLCESRTRLIRTILLGGCAVWGERPE